MESPESTELDFRKVPHIAGVPRYMFRTYLQSFLSMISAFVRGDRTAAFENELGLWFFAGVMKERWKDRREPIPPRRGLVTRRQKHLDTRIFLQTQNDRRNRRVVHRGPAINQYAAFLSVSNPLKTFVQTAQPLD